MLESGLSAEQEELLWRLVDAVERYKPMRDPFDYRKNMSVAEDVVTLMHRGWPKDAPAPYVGDLDALADEGYIRRELLTHGARFELTAKAYRLHATVKVAQDANSGSVGATPAATQSGSSEPSHPSPLLVLEEIRGGQRNPTLRAQIVGHGRFEGVNSRIGSRQLFFIYLLFQSKRTDLLDGQEVTIVTEDQACKELVKWSKARHLSLRGVDRGDPKRRIGKMWPEFVRQIENDTMLKGLFTTGAKDEHGKKLYVLRLRPEETQILVPSIPALFKR